MEAEKNSPNPILSFGAKAAGVSFNPSQKPWVDAIKGLYAQVIDLQNDQRAKATSPEAKRYFSKAISYAEDALMNAVKAETWQYE